MAALALAEPERFSPNVTLRAVVQDYLLPTVAYFGGAAEVAYFAQTAESYRVLDRPATPILHRASLTVVERRTGRTLERYGLRLEDFFGGLDPVIARVVEEHLGAEVAGAFDETDAGVARALDELQAKLRDFDPTLADALDGGRRKIAHQLEGLRARFHRAQMAARPRRAPPVGARRDRPLPREELCRSGTSTSRPCSRATAATSSSGFTTPSTSRPTTTTSSTSDANRAPAASVYSSHALPELRNEDEDRAPVLSQLRHEP